MLIWTMQPVSVKRMWHQPDGPGFGEGEGGHDGHLGGGYGVLALVKTNQRYRNYPGKKVIRSFASLKQFMKPLLKNC